MLVEIGYGDTNTGDEREIEIAGGLDVIQYNLECIMLRGDHWDRGRVKTETDKPIDKIPGKMCLLETFD